MGPYYVVIFSVLVLQFLQTYGQRNEHPKIVGGNYADEGQFPYQVSLRIKNRHFCGGSIINHRFILTAAHCLRNFNDTAIKVVTGSTKLDEGGNEYQSVRIVPHERYSSLFIRNDIGLIEVDEDIEFSDNVKPVDLPTGNFDKSDYPAYLSGWGKTNYPGSIPNELQYIKLTVIDQKQCRNFSMRVTNKNICTLNGRGEGACHGDSGGPLVADGVQIGVVSWGIPCAKNKPDVFTRVYSYLNWIKENTESSSSSSSSESNSSTFDFLDDHF